MVVRLRDRVLLSAHASHNRDVVFHADQSLRTAHLWVRLGRRGPGLWAKYWGMDDRRLSFADRNRLRPALRLGPFIFRILRKEEAGGPWC